MSREIKIENPKRPDVMTVTSYSMRCGIRLVRLLAVRRDARCSGSLGVGGGDHRLGISFVEDGLDDLLFLGAENFGQVVIELRLLLLETWRGR
jgi:hypothetical protein